MGGYAALLFGALCEADMSIATSPQVSIAPEERVAWQDTRWRQKILETRAASKTPEYFNIRETLMGSNKTNHRIYYAAGHSPDNKHAEYLIDIPGIAVTALPSGGHNGAKVLRDSGQLDQILAELRSVRP
jgi:hypothetical protein